MDSIFISYKSEDREKAGQLAAVLEGRGYEVWWDQEIPIGKRFDQVINERLNAARCVVVLWSSRSVDSDWVLEEASEGRNSSKLVPAMIEDCEIPLGFRRVQAANLVGWDGEADHSGFQRLMASIEALMGAPPAPQPSAPAPKSVEAKPERAQWPVYLALLPLGFYYLIAMGNTCANRDIATIANGIGLVTAIVMLITNRQQKYTWLLAVLASFLFGLPYGNSYGEIYPSDLLGLEMGTNCQFIAGTYLAMAVSLGIAFVLDYLSYTLPGRKS